MFSEYDARTRTNRSIGGRDRELHLYFEAHLPAFDAALPKYLARAAAIRDDELTRDGLQARLASRSSSRLMLFGARGSSS